MTGELTRGATALVTDGALRTSLLVVRSLGRRGVRVRVVERDSPLVENLAGLSRYTHERVAVPNNMTDPEEYGDALLAMASKFDVIVPTGMHSIEVIARRRADFDRVTRVLLPAWDTIAAADNTRALLAVAEQIGVPCPRSYELSSYATVDALASDVRYPAIVKTGVEGGLPPADRYQVVTDARELEAAVTRMRRITPDPLIQELIPGEGVGFEALYDTTGRVVAEFCHRRLRQYPLTGGPSTYCESCRLPLVEEYGRRLLDHLGWTGLAMVEFKIDSRDGLPKLMEINPRPWGSMALPIRAGIDFPWLAYCLARGEPVRPVVDFRAGIRLRYVVNDAQAALAEVRAARSMRERFAIAGSILDPRVKEGILSVTDPIPSLAYVWKAVRRTTSRPASSRS